MFNLLLPLIILAQKRATLSMSGRLNTWGCTTPAADESQNKNRHSRSEELQTSCPAAFEKIMPAHYRNGISHEYIYNHIETLTFFLGYRPLASAGCMISSP